MDENKSKMKSTVEVSPVVSSLEQIAKLIKNNIRKSYFQELYASTEFPVSKKKFSKILNIFIIRLNSSEPRFKYGISIEMPNTNNYSFKITDFFTSK